MANLIYRGPPSRQARTVNLPVTTAAKPGTLVVRVADTFVVAVAADDEKNILILSNNDFVGQDLETAYEANDTATAYQVEPAQQYQARLAAATYALGDSLSIGASGYLEKAAATEVVLARYTGSPGDILVGALGDIEIANSFKSA